MTTRTVCILLILLAIEAAPDPLDYIAMQYNAIRVVNHPGTGFDNAFLTRVAAARYNYICVNFPLVATDSTYGNGDIYTNLQSCIREACVKVEQAKLGLRLIPQIKMGSRWAVQPGDGWQVIQRYENNAVQLNTIASAEFGIWAHTVFKIFGCASLKNNDANTGSHSWAYEPDGVDKSVYDVLRAVKQGFIEANVSFPLEFIHLGHDEPHYLNWCLIGGPETAGCKTTFPYDGMFVPKSYSQTDYDYIRTMVAQGHSAQTAYQMLLADELHRRIIQIQDVCGPRVKMMIYGDSFDDESWGNVPLRAAQGNGSRITLCGVKELPGLTETQRKTVKDNLIVVIWNYNNENPITPLKMTDGNPTTWFDAYTENTTMSRLASYGYNFLYCSAFTKSRKKYQTSKLQAREYASTSLSYRNNCLGYYAAAWVNRYPESSRDARWDIIEYLFNDCNNKSSIP